MKCCKSRKASSLLNSWGINFKQWNRIFSVSLANLTFFCFSPRGFDVLLRMKSITVQLQFIRGLALHRSRWMGKKCFTLFFKQKNQPVFPPTPQLHTHTPLIFIFSLHFHWGIFSKSSMENWHSVQELFLECPNPLFGS